MLHVSDLLLQHREISTFAELVDVVRERASSEMFFRMDLKPPYHDTPNNWEMILEAAFSSANESQGNLPGATNRDSRTDNKATGGETTSGKATGGKATGNKATGDKAS